MTESTVKIICDSITTEGNRITSIECSYPRYMHPQMLRHRLLSRNVNSSRAIPVELMVKQVETDPVMPSYIGKNKAGMTAEEEIAGIDRLVALNAIRQLSYASVRCAKTLEKIGVHKQTVNRYLEPFLQVHEIITATSWQNFFDLRLTKSTQPETKDVAAKIKLALESSTPDELDYGMYHLPYINSGMRQHARIEQLLFVSAALCARLSYSTYDHGKRIMKMIDNAQSASVWVEDQIGFAKRLLADGHLSPFEHQATPANPNEWHHNFYGWKSHRFILTGDAEKR
jgi:hypothetical protein